MVDTSNPTPRASGGIVGLVVAGRYRVVGLVSSGANTLIADAVDLERDVPVTVKILRPDLGADPAFQERFGDVARTAAALHHPNIASVLDWGEFQADGRTSVFWVVEHLSGGSLRDLLDRGRLLTPSQALVVGLEACRALTAAHQAGEVHTELTPSKLVFGSDRRLRIVDFGLARLLGEESWQEPARVPTHVARYASPEQALGMEPDPKTDVYALSLTLLEAVTGAVPFAADSTVATLSGRVGKLLPVSADLGSLAAVLERAGRPEPEDRSTAAEFGQGLVQAAGALPRPEPVPILSTGLFDSSELRRPTDPTGGFARPAGEPAGAAGAAQAPDESTPSPADTDPDTVDPDPVDTVDTDDSDGGLAVAAGAAVVAGAAVAAAAEPDAPADAPASDAATEGTDTPAEAEAVPPPPAQPFLGDTVEPAPATEPMPAVAPAPFDAGSTELYDDERRGMRTGRLLLIVVLVLAGVGALAYAGSLLVRTKSHEVPVLTGATEAVARAEIEGNDWNVITERERNDDFPDAGTVIRTDPTAGVDLDEGSDFLMVVSEGPEFRTLEEYAELAVDDATAAVTALGLDPVQADRRVFSETVPAGSVVSWQVVGSEGLAAGAKILPGETVEFTVSRGPRPRTVPDLFNLTVEEASAAIEDLQLRFRQTAEVFSDSIEPGHVVSQDPEAGSRVDRNSRVRVEVSKGPDVVFFPDVEGLRYNRAKRILEREGFVIGSVLGTTEGNVVSTSVDGSNADAGEIYRRGTTVDVVSL